MNIKKTAFLCIILLLFNMLLYIGTVSFDFLTDDHRLIVENPRIKSPDAFVESIGTKFFAFPDFPFLHYWRPMILFSLMVDYHVWELKPAGYHLTNIVINGLNAVMLFLLFIILSGNLRFSFLVSALFSIHPSHVVATSWISGRTDLISCFLLLGSILFFALYLKKDRRIFYFLTLLVYFFALLSKENAVLFPFVALFMILFYSSLVKERMKILLFNMIPLFVMMGLFIFLHQRLSGMGESLKMVSLADFTLILKTMGAYTRIILFPFFSNPRFDMVHFDIHHLEFGFYFFLALCIFVLLYVKRKHYPNTIFSLVFLIFLLPVIDPKFVPSFPNIAMRFAYVSSIFMGVFFVETAQVLQNIRLRKIYTVLVAVLALFFTVETVTFQSYMKDDKTHFEKLLVHYPDDTALLVPYALLLSREGKYQRALAVVNHAMVSNESNPWIDVSEMGGLFKANLLIAMGNLDEGKVLVEKIYPTVRKDDSKYFAHLILAKYHEKRREIPAALGQLEKAGTFGETPYLFFQMTLMHAELGNFKEALRYLEKTKSLNPDMAGYEKLKSRITGDMKRRSR